ncbi:MAG: hypothetical protein JWL62_2802 [Hyphomicrobiales bacterium]|nr:hypothetical protein [Hyphomicrobiales bacterium]
MANMGTIDRTLRIVLGAVLIIAPFVSFAADVFVGWGGWKYAVSSAGLVMIVTAAFRFCPAYTLLGIRTCAMPGK